MRIGNGPRLVVPRPGARRRRWGYYGNPGYERSLAEQRERIRRMLHDTKGDAKRQTTSLSSLSPGEHYRCVDGHGRCAGPRLTATKETWLSRDSAQVRRVARQEEDLHSQLSRMLKRAHRLAIRDN